MSNHKMSSPPVKENVGEKKGKSKYGVLQTWSLFNAQEKKNIAIYIAGIMLYKFGLEAFNGSLVALATNRYDNDAKLSGTPAQTFYKVGLLTGLNQAFQCVGSILIAPLIKRFPTKMVLSIAILVFGLLTAILLVVDAGTGGRIKPDGWDKTHKKEDWSYYGTYNTDGIIVIYCITGVAYGMVELIRRVIPRDIVGGDVQKLRRMDAMVHIFYEVSGTGGAFCTALALIPKLGNNMSFIITPIFFTFASITWWFISHLNFEKPSKTTLSSQPMYIKAVLGGFYLFGESVWVGAKIIFTSRKFIWLVPGYSFALYGHRYLENAIAPVIARRYLGNSAWSQIMVGGSNFGELLGALFVFLFTNLVKTPIPWLRLDACLLLIIWYLPTWWVPTGRVTDAWVVAATFIPVSFGWAAGDVSLAAYIQALLQRKEDEVNDVSPLGAVMAFLYCTYIVIYAITSAVVGRYIDKVGAANTNNFAKGIVAVPDYPDKYINVHPAVKNIAGVQFTVIAIVMILATLIPKGSLSFNPKSLYGETLQLDDTSEENLVDEETGVVVGEQHHKERVIERSSPAVAEH
jgi:MFS family permease